MTALSTIRRTAVGVALGAMLVSTAACGSDSSSSSDNAPSTAQLTARLKKEPELQKAFSALGQGQSSAKVEKFKNAVYVCFAEALRKSAPADKLKNYLSGDVSAKDIVDKSQQSKFESEGKACVTKAQSSLTGG